MSVDQELFRFDTHGPLDCTMYRLGEIASHRHEFFEVDMILSGTCIFTMDERTYALQAEDVTAIDCYSPHAFRGTDCVMVSIRFSPSQFSRILSHPMQPHFFCNSAVQGKNSDFARLRTIIASIVKNNANQSQGYELRNCARIYEMMDLLHNSFRLEDSNVHYERNYRYAQRVREISRLIREHHTENISLSDLAEMVHLSPPYLSRFFNQQFGMNFLTYLTQIRLEHATDLLLTSDMTIEEISAESGFPNSHAFVQAFKKKNDLLPSVYRRKNKALAGSSSTSVPILEQTDYLSALKKYLVPETPAAPEADCISCDIRLDTADPGRTLRHTWRNVCGVASAADLLLSDVQEMVRRLQREIGFTFIKFNGIFSDDLQVASRGADGAIQYNFAYLDKVFDFLQSVHLTPMIHLSFMPKVMAKTPDKYLFHYLVSEPADLDEWAALVGVTVRHLIHRYGLKEVRRWKFSVWHQPNSFEALYGFSNDEDFYEFYRRSFRAVKDCDEEISVGTPPTFYLLQEQQANYQNWYIDFMKWCGGHACMPDFLNFHYYDTVIDLQALSGPTIFGFAQPMTLRNAPDGFPEFTNRVLAERETLGLSALPIYLTEWNNTPSQEDLLNDTCFKSCYIVKNILENYDRLESFGYWSLTDLMGEAPTPPHTFYGGIGLFTTGGIPKASYYAMCLLRQLGDEMIGSGEGWFASRRGDACQIILYNYRHFSALYAKGERFDMTFTDRYTPFSPDKYLDVHIEMQNMTAAHYSVKELSVSRSSGSAYDQWIAMGAIEPESREEEELLKSLSKPHLNKYTADPEDGILRLSAMIDMLEVRLILISPAG